MAVVLGGLERCALPAGGRRVRIGARPPLDAARWVVSTGHRGCGRREQPQRRNRGDERARNQTSTNHVPSSWCVLQALPVPGGGSRPIAGYAPYAHRETPI